MKIPVKTSIVIIIVLALLGCEYGVKKGHELTENEIEFIKDLEILNENESIIQFHSQSGESDEVKHAGNFYTKNRIASYWINKDDESQSKVNSAYYSQIDTIFFVDNTEHWDLGSYLQVETSDSRNFGVYVSGDSDIVWGFFEGALKEWKK